MYNKPDRTAMPIRSSQKSKSRSNAPKRARRSSVDSAAHASLLSVPQESTEDRVLYGIRRFIANSIFFNSQVAEKAGFSLTDMQMIHMLQLHGPSTPTRLAAATGLSSGGVTVALDRLEKAGCIR